MTMNGSRCIFCQFRPLFLKTTRAFATTPFLHRTKPNLKQSSQTRIGSRKSKGPHSSDGIYRRGLISQDFPAIVSTTLLEYKNSFSSSHPLLKNWDKFKRYVLQAAKLGDRSKWGPLWELKASLQQTYLRDGIGGLKKELAYRLKADDITAKYSTEHLAEQKKVADLRFPAEWYPSARSLQRTIHLHVGPTNSGKTYHALQRLEASKKGFYAGPLRLLAQEVYARFSAKGIPCGLITGDEVKTPEDEIPTIISNTVEMVSLAKDYEVGVIDEIQMIADQKRGWAWTRAFLGARATELHLCGETRAVPLIRELVALTGDVLKIHQYERLNPLKVMSKSLEGDLRNLQKGDCLVSFSRVGIHALKNDIEKVTGKRAAIVYGSLPAEIRTQQASLFNDPNNDYDFLVASDAIGMGLNLSCKRIIFETLVKRLPTGLTRLSIPEVKQIAGRAGRYRPANQSRADQSSDSSNIGLVTSLEQVDLPYIQQAMSFEPPPLSAAGIYPPDTVFQHFADYFPPGVPFQYIIKRLLDIAQIRPLFFMCNPSSQLESAEITDTVKGLGIEDQLVFMAAPIYSRDPVTRGVVRAFVECAAKHQSGRLLDIPSLNLEVLEEPVSGKKDYLCELESLHKSIILYSWLSYRMGGVFTDRTLAGHVKEMVEERMIRALAEFSANKKLRKDASLHRQRALHRQTMEHGRLLAQARLQTGDQGVMSIDLLVDKSPIDNTSSDTQRM